MSMTLGELKRCRKDVLINEVYNRWISDHADEGGDKAIPYMGWYWRWVDFVGRDITIGKGGGIVAVMENNKWGYPQRGMTPEECDTFTGYIDRAIAESRRGGQLSETTAKTRAVLAELHAWMQTLDVPDEEDYPAAASSGDRGVAVADALSSST